MSRTRTAVVSAALTLAALGGTAAVAGGAAAGDLHGSTGPDAAFKRVGQVTRTAARATQDAALRTGGTTTASTSYKFATVLDGQPVRWDPCTPIRWTANTSRGPAGGLKVLQDAVARVAAATGTTWQYVGPSSTVPSGAVLPKSAAKSYPPVLLGWTDGSASDLLAGQAKSVLGMTRTAWFGVQTADGRRIAATRAAVVALDRTDALPLRGGTSWEAVATHELAHVMGLTHVSDTRQLMATVLPRSIASLQAGDRAGLARLGKAAGCVVVPS